MVSMPSDPVCRHVLLEVLVFFALSTIFTNLSSPFWYCAGRTWL